MSTMNYTETLQVTHCWCGIALAIPANLYRVAHDEGKSVHCPLGHTFVFGDTYKEQYEDAMRRLNAEAINHRATKDLLKAEERSHATTRGHLTRQRKRAKEGVCPCCHRTFKQLSAHMKTKHPDFKPEELPA